MGGAYPHSLSHLSLTCAPSWLPAKPKGLEAIGCFGNGQWNLMTLNGGGRWEKNKVMVLMPLAQDRSCWGALVVSGWASPKGGGLGDMSEWGMGCSFAYGSWLSCFPLSPTKWQEVPQVSWGGGGGDGFTGALLRVLRGLVRVQDYYLWKEEWLNVSQVV